MTERVPIPADADVVDVARYGLRPGVVYMPVPRCGACRWWTTREEGISGAIGECMFSKQGGADFYSRTPIMTHMDFGCVQCEAAPASSEDTKP